MTTSHRNSPSTSLSLRRISRPANRERGFTLVELLVVVVIAGFLATLGVPALQRMIVRGQVESLANETIIMLQNARLEAVRRQAPVVVRINYDESQMEAFVDLNDAAGNPGSDLIFNPPEGLRVGERDYLLPTVARRGPEVEFWGAANAAPEGGDEVSGFTSDPDGGSNIAVFDPDGSIRAVGAFRFGDNRGNHLEARVSPRATARVILRKYNDAYTDADGTNYHEKGNTSTGDALWEWYL